MGSAGSMSKSSSLVYLSGNGRIPTISGAARFTKDKENDTPLTVWPQFSISDAIIS